MPKSQEPDLLTPSREHLSSVHRISEQANFTQTNTNNTVSTNTNNKASIKEIKVEGISIEKKFAYYNISLANCDLNGGHFRVRTEKHMFEAVSRSEEPYHSMMQKTRQKIHNNAKK